jgi:peptidyl-prolyl cis-trans isomerase SurA
MLRFVFVIVLAFFYIESASQTNKPVKPQTLFTIKRGPRVTADEFIYIYKKNHQAKEDYTEQKINEYLNLFINFKLKVTEARQRGNDTTAAFLKEYNSYRDELRKPYLPESKIVDSLVQVTYSRLQEEVRASHILINIKHDATPADTAEAYTKALEIKHRAAGGEDFASLASLYSEDPSARLNKGDLGYFTALQMVFPFENAVYSGAKGEVVGPVRTRFGYHIIKIEDRKPARGEVEVSHIMIRTGERDETAAKNLIFDIHDQLRGGMAWEDLCQKYSEDPGSKNNGGRLRPFGVRAMEAVPEFDRVAFYLQKPGELSDPFQTQYGWHIIRLERKIPLPSFEEAYASLKTRVARDERVQVSRQALMHKLKRDFSFQENASLKAKVFALADSSLTKGKWIAPAASGKEWLFSLRSQKVTAREFYQYIKKNQKPSALPPTQYIEQLFNGCVEQHIHDQLEAKIIRDNPDFKLLLTEYYEGILLFDIMEREVWKKASDDSVGQRAYFEANKNSYSAGERMAAVIYSSNVADGITTLKGHIEKSDTVQIKNMLERRNARQERGIYQKNDRPVLSKIEWEKGIHTAEHNGIHYLVQVNELVPPGPMSFEEARAAVISDYQDSVEKLWLETLRKKHPVKVNAKTKAYVVQKLTL